MATFLLAGCASVERVDSLEGRVEALRVNLQNLQAKHTELAVTQSGIAARLDAADTALEQILAVLAGDLRNLRSDASNMDVRLSNVEAVITWRGRLKVSVAGDVGWQVIYANSTGRSQMLRIRRVEPASTSTKLHVSEIQRLPKLIIPGVDTEAAGEISPPEWDLSAIGAVRSQRLACGREIAAMSIGGKATLDILVTEDPNPVVCN